MLINTNYHTHIYLCKHAHGTIDDYVRKAISLEYKKIGISDHGPIHEYYQKKFFSRRMNFNEYYNIYLNDLNIAKLKYQDKITVLGAVEIEFYEDMSVIYSEMSSELDYLILGQHNIKYPNDSFKTIYQCSTLEDAILYKERVIQGLKTGYFKILAHPDIYLMFYKEWDKEAISLAKEIIEASIEANVLLEINANGFRKSKILLKDGQEVNKYPRREFWKLVSTYPEAKIIISDDCHELEHLHDDSTIKAYELARSLNLNITEPIFTRSK